jgi:outer membrane protein assembly factor BamB
MTSVDSKDFSACISPARMLAAVLWATALVNVPAAFAADDWVMAMHDSRHTGRTSEIASAPLTLAWTWTDPIAYDNSTQFHPTMHFWLPIFYRGLICVQGGLNANRVFCLNPASGAPVWTQTNPGWGQNGSTLYQFDNYPVAANGRILNATTDLTATMDASNGADNQYLYNTNGAAPYGGAAAWGNMAYLQFLRTDDCTEAFYIAQSPSTVTWSNMAGGYVVPDNRNNYIDWSMRIPAVDAGVVYYSMLGYLYARDARTGRQLWRWGQWNFNSSPAVANGVVYFYAGQQGKLLALDTNHMTYTSPGVPQIPTLWSAAVPDANSPIVSDGVVYVGSSNGKFYALDAATGAAKWTLDVGSAYGFSEYEMPAISGNTIFVPTTKGDLVALDKNTGVEIWRYTGTSPLGPVVVANGMVFVSDLRFRLYGFTAQSAVIGPAVTSLSLSRASNAQQNAINLTGSGFFGGGATSQVQGVQLDNGSVTQLLGYTVASDQSITGIVIPAGLPAGTYRVRVRTNAGLSADEPAIEIAGAGTYFPAVLGQSYGTVYGTTVQTQRHLARTSTGNLIAVYAGQADSGSGQDSTYNISRDGGLTWTVQAAVHAAPWNNYMSASAPTSSVWMDAQDHLNVSYARWTTDGQSFEKFSLNSVDLLVEDSGLPVSLLQGYSSATGTGISQSGGRRWVVFIVGGQVIPRYSDDGGMTWTQMAAINQTSSTMASLTAYEDRPVIVYTEGTNLAWSQWNGAEWAPGQALPGPISSVQTFSAVTTSDGRIHVVYSTTAGGITYEAYSGSAWSAPVALTATGNWPSITTDGTNLWCFYANASGDLVFQRTSNGNWNPPVQVTSDGNYNTAPSTLSLSPDGGIPVIWTSGPSSGYTVKSASIPVSAGLPAAIDVSSQVKVTQTSYVYNRTTRFYSCAMTVSNTSGSTINGPISTVLTNLTSGVSVVNGNGTRNGNPYLTVTNGPLAPGASVTVQVQFNDPAAVPIYFTPVTYSGSF